MGRPETDPQETSQTLSAIKEFTRFLKDMEEDLSRQSKRLHNKEIAQSAGFVGTGIHEAVHYLEIVKRVVEKTQRALNKKELETPSRSISTQ